MAAAATPGSGPARPGRLRRRGWAAATVPVLLGMLALVVLALGVPLGSLLRWLLVGASTRFDTESLLAAAASTLGLGLAAGVLTTALALPVAWLAVRYRGRLSTLLERSTYVGSALPGIVVALALVTVAIRFARPLYQTMALLLLAYAILFLPRAVVSVRAGIAQAPPVLRGRRARARRRPGRHLAPGHPAADRAGPGRRRRAGVPRRRHRADRDPAAGPDRHRHAGDRVLVNASSALEYGAAAPYAALMVLVSAPATLLLTRRSRRELAG